MSTQSDELQPPTPTAKPHYGVYITLLVTGVALTAFAALYGEFRSRTAGAVAVALAMPLLGYTVCLGAVAALAASVGKRRSLFLPIFAWAFLYAGIVDMVALSVRMKMQARIIALVPEIDAKLKREPTIEPEVEPIAASQPTPEPLDWQKEAIKVYPELGVKGSRMNQLFVETYRELQATNKSYFEDRTWPLKLAGWCEIKLEEERAR